MTATSTSEYELAWAICEELQSLHQQHRARYSQLLAAFGEAKRLGNAASYVTFEKELGELKRNGLANLAQLESALGSATAINEATSQAQIQAIETHLREMYQQRDELKSQLFEVETEIENEQKRTSPERDPVVALRAQRERWLTNYRNSASEFTRRLVGME